MNFVGPMIKVSYVSLFDCSGLTKFSQSSGFINCLPQCAFMKLYTGVYKLTCLKENK